MMKANLKLGAENIGNVICIKTVDNFVCEGHIKSVTDTAIEINDFKSKNVLTIFTFEIKEFDIVRSDGQVEKGRTVPKVVPVKEVKEVSPSYEHPIFGRLSRDDRPLQFVNDTADGHEVGLDQGQRSSVYECHYVYVNSVCDAYDNAMRCLNAADAVGVSFYHNEYRQEGAFKLLTLSWRPHWSLIVDAHGLSAGEFRTRFRAVVELLQSDSRLKVVHAGGNIVPAIRSALHVEMGHFVDVQLLHYGLHNARVAERFRDGLSYSQMVQLLFCTAFPHASANTGATTMTDVLHKIAFNAHFLVPIYHLMLNRLLEPVRLLSARLSRNDPDAVESDPTLLDLNLCQTTSIDFEILPRSLQFWSYRDNAPALKARRVVDNEMQQEKRAVANGSHCDVPSISKTLARAQERAQCGETGGRGYYEEVSDDDDEQTAFRAANEQWQHRGNDSNNDHQQQQEQPQSHPRNASAEASVAAVSSAIGAPTKRGVGRGRGIISSVTHAMAVMPPIGTSTPLAASKPASYRSSPGKPGTPGAPPIEVARNLTGDSASSGGQLFSKGRGMPGRAKGSSRSHSSKNSRGGCGGGMDSLHQSHQFDEPEESFCEMSMHRWNRNGPGNLSLCLDQFADDLAAGLPTEGSRANRWQQQQQAMGIMWNNVGLKKAKEMDDLYDEFGL